MRRAPALALLVAAPLTLAYLILAPPAGDLAAATYRSDLFARVGFTTWDTGWYAAHGHWLPAYSLFSPALGALLGVRLLLALSALAASLLFALIAERVFNVAAARLAAGWFALGICVSLLSGRVPYDLGFAIGLGAVLASIDGRWAWALGLAVLTSLASPVSGAFLALAALASGLGVVLSQKGPTRARGLLTRPAWSLAARARVTSPGANNTHGAGASDSHHETGARAVDRDALRCFALTGAAIAPILILTIAYPEGGYEPFASSAFWPALAGVVLIAWLLPQGPLTTRARMTIRIGAVMYALALIAAYAIHTPMGGNAARLGPLLAGPLLAGVLWESAPGATNTAGTWRIRRPRALLAAMAPALLYWQLATPIRDYASISGDASVNASYYAPVLAELRVLTGGKPTIVEVPLTKAHWEAAYLAGHDGLKLARGWERQLDTRYAAIFYRPTLSPATYRMWLLENKVRYVALPDAPLDKAGQLEGASIARGLPYLRELWHSEHWRVYRFIG